MRGFRPLALALLTVLLTAVLTAVTALTAGAAGAAPPPVRYVALGDSYSSGLGAGSSYTGGSCDRSGGAFSALWSASHAPASYTSLACAGATTATVMSSQLPSVASTTTLISITAGGNDVGFANIMTTCALHGTSDCVAAVNDAENAANMSLPAQLDRTYSAISSAAPAAKVVVLSYPLFYQLHVWYCVGLSETSRTKIDEGINLVDDLTAAAAGRHGFTFADVRSAFAGHQLCSGSKWLHAVDLAHIQESYHPTASGQQNAYLPVFSAAVG
ncbi:lysophospholipase L1-like esterase [Nakamurella sp. UYEF19]|uniref:SGNH/GDSL hydrolase family protein n=1 Tax=Nakamurella sp. UYEF19 TaxID=1756392 RepID=UPI003395BB47